MQKNPWKTVVWIVEFVFLFLALTAPLNPFINTKFGVAAWCYFMMGVGCVRCSHRLSVGLSAGRFLHERLSPGGLHRFDRKEAAICQSWFGLSSF